MRILFLNWRDIKNPKAGGAELVSQEIAKRWTQQGHEVTFFAASFPGAADTEVVDGVRIIRRGRQWTVHWHAFRYYRQFLKDKIDVVIDEVNTIPFLTPLYVKKPKVVYFNQLAREVWFYEAFFPLNFIGFVLEPLYLLLYRQIEAMVISKSTKQDLVKRGFRRVDIFPMAIDFKKEQPFIHPKEPQLTLIFVARLVKSKRPEEAIRALVHVKSQIPEVQMWFVGGGSGDYFSQLKELVYKLSLEKNVKFLGYVKNHEKYQLMSRAHFIIVTSVKEGWGLIVTEANAVKTPGVVYDVDGLRDVVRDGVTGSVVASNPKALADEVLRLWGDQSGYTQISQNAYLDSQNYSWEKTAQKSLEIITKAQKG